MARGKRAYAAATAAVAATALLGASAAPSESSGARITIYRAPAKATAATPPGQAAPPAPARPPDFAVITERRTLAVGEGGAVRLVGVPVGLDPASVQVVDVTVPGASVVEQAYEYDLGSIDALLARHVGHPVVVVGDAGEVKGVLRRFDAQVLVIETSDTATPLVIVDRARGVKDIRLGGVPGGLATQPTLRWRVNLKGGKAGDHVFDVTYQTGGLSWGADYVAVVGDDGKRVDLSGWITVANATGVAWASATLRLVWGEPMRGGAAGATATPGQPYDPYGVYGGNASTPAPLHVYDLPAPVALAGAGQKQIELFAPAAGLVATTVAVLEYTPQYAYYYRQQGYPVFDQNMDGYGVRKIEQLGTHLEVDVGQKGGPAMALPPGRLKVYQRDAKTGALSLVAEDDVGPTAPGGRLRVRVGSTRDLTAERRQVEFRLDDRNREMREKVEVRLKNTRKDPVEVVVSESLWRWRTWTIEGESTPWTRSDDGLRASFRVKVPAGGEAVLTYTAKYHTW